MTDPNPPPSDQLLLFAAVASSAVKEGRPATQSHGPPDEPLHDRTEGDGGEKAYLELPWDFRSSFPEPLEEAYVFGTLHPDDAELENIAAIHIEHEAEAIALLDTIEALEEARRLGVHPATGKPPRTQKAREELAERFDTEPGQLRRQFDNHIAVYADAFGFRAADAFALAIQLRHHGIDVVQRTRAEPTTISLRVISNPRRHVEDLYEPGHPWHYLFEGDRATPVPAELIEPAPRLYVMPNDLPENDEAQSHRMLIMRHRGQVQQLDIDKRRYEQLRTTGFDALSTYDRTIAYGGNLQVAWASAVASNYLRISHRLVDVAGLEKLLGQNPGLFDSLARKPTPPTPAGA